jgi:hypothetical protein
MLLEEAAQFDIVWPFLDRVTSMEQKVAAIDAAIRAHQRESAPSSWRAALLHQVEWRSNASM